MADEGGPEATGITRVDLLRKEEPDVGPIARTGNLQRSRNPKRPAGLDECQGVLAPLLLVEVARQEVAGVVVERWVDSARVLACRVIVDHRVRDGREGPMLAIGAFDPGLVADARRPLVHAHPRLTLFSPFLSLP